MFEYANQKRDPVSIIFYCGLVPFGVFWVVSRSVTAAFALQSYLITVIVFVIYPFEMKARKLKQWPFWKKILKVGVPINLLVLTGLWWVDTWKPVLVTGIVMISFVAFVIGVIEMIAVGEILDRFQGEDDGIEPFV